MTASSVPWLDGTTVRLCYAKGEELRFSSHLDTMCEIERLLMRAELPVLYSEGYSPRPKISAGPPLALGWTSNCEWIDLRLAGEWSEENLAGLLETLNRHSVDGMKFLSAGVMEKRVKALMESIDSSTYLAELPSPPFETSLGELEQRFRKLLDAEIVIVTREHKGLVKHIDVRPLIRDVSVLSQNELMLTVSSGRNGSVKPTEVIRAALDITDEAVPLIKIKKVGVATAEGETPLAGAVALAEVEDFETRNTNYWEPAREARGYSRG